MKKQRVIIVGAGPAGLMAAGQAAESGAEVILLEKMKKSGLKLCLTGKGRCNITNIADTADFINHFGKSGLFLRQAFSRYFNTDLMEFLNELGLDLVTERGGRVFPASGKATDVRDILLSWVKKSNVEVRQITPVDAILCTNGRISAVLSNDHEMPCDAVIIATGGCSYRATGSTGDGYRLAESAGHTIIPVRQALVPLETSGDTAQRMAGLNLRNVNVRMFVNGKKKKEEFGEVVFNKFGIGGPTIITLSGATVDCLRNGDKVIFSIDLKPALDEKKLDARLLRDLASRGTEKFNSLLRGLIPREMVPVCLDLINIPGDRLVSTLTVKERKKIGKWLKDFRLEITGYRPFSEAIVTAGGVNTKEVDPRTMESRKTKGLFFAGELLDLQADTGGFNLQAAFSTGWLAGRAAGLSVRENGQEMK